MSTTLAWSEPQRHSSDVQLEDPLAFNALETQIAKSLWPGFTRHTTEPAYYAMACYGLLIAEMAARHHGLTPSDDTMRSLFYRWERLWAVAVCAANDGDLSHERSMRGSDSVLTMYRAQIEKRSTLDYQFVGRRGELGALGAYLTSLRDHGLVREDRLRLTPLGWDLAQWMWDVPGAAADPFQSVLIELLKPGNTLIGKALMKSTLPAMGERGALSAINARRGYKALLWQRFFASGDPRFAPLREMANVLRSSNADARTMFDRLVNTPATSAGLRQLAGLALVFGDIALTLRTIFDRMYETVLAGGYASDWGACVRAAIPAGFSATLNTHIANWRRFGAGESMLSVMMFGPKFNQVMRRMNAQNAYHIFESVLHLHVQMQRIRGKGSWIERKGEVVYLRHAGYELRALKGDEWAPGYRIPAMRAFLSDLEHQA